MARVAHLCQACEDSLKRLDLDYIDLYFQHRLDTTIPTEVTVSYLTSLSIPHLHVFSTSILDVHPHHV